MELRQRYEAFLRRFWHASQASGKVRFLREIDHAIPRVFRPNEAPSRNVQVEPLAMLNVDSRGNVSSFSPELLGLKNAQYADYLLGNIHTHSLAQIHDACLQSPMFRDICKGVEACARSCEYFSVCGGGAPVNKLFETGSFTGTRTSYCTLTQMVPTDLLLEAFDRLEQELASDAADRAATPGPQAASPNAKQLSRVP